MPREGRFSLVPVLLAALAVWIATPANATVISGPIVNPANGHTYYLLSQSSWTASEAEAIALGGHLVTINDAAENTWVWNTFSGLASGASNLWIGIHDPLGNGTFVWSSGQPVTYTNWGSGEPNNIGSEIYGYMVGNDGGYSGSPTTYWNNVTATTLSGSFQNPFGVVEVPEPSMALLLAVAACAALVEAVWRRGSAEFAQMRDHHLRGPA